MKLKSLIAPFTFLLMLTSFSPIQAQEEIEWEAGSSNLTIYRLYNPNSGEHFYTGDYVEKQALVKIGWRNEGPEWNAPLISNTPIYRLYNPNNGDHHYTSNQNEVKTLSSLGWRNEGIKLYSDDSYGTSIYRLYNPNTKGAGAHHYTASQNERNALVNMGWIYEEIGWYGLLEKPNSNTSLYTLGEIAGKYVFPMGHGGNIFTLDSNGNFAGDYGYMLRGDTGPDYPNGTRIYCNYSGKMKIQGNQLIITEFSTSAAPNSYSIQDGIRYLAVDAYQETGMERNASFTIYPPGTPYTTFNSTVTSQLKNGFHDGSTTPTYSLILKDRSSTERGYRGLLN